MIPGTTSPTPEPGSLRRSLRRDDGRLLRGRRSRARIRAAARELFAERGFDGATLRAIAERAGMGASSIYRHVRSKEELLADELADLQEQAWRRFRAEDDRNASTRQRVTRFLDLHQRLLAEAPDLTTIALRATTQPEARVARRVLALHDRTMGLLAEVLQGGRLRGDLDPRADVVAAARTIFHVTTGARVAWVNGLVDAEGCRAAIESSVETLFRGLETRA